MGTLNQKRKVVFTALAHVKIVEGVKKVVMQSPKHWMQQVSRLNVGKQYGVVIEEYKATRSREQLAYYWVLIGYIADHTGHTPEELHDAIVRQKFGTTLVEVAGIKQEVRKSIADSARFPKGEMVELITEVLEICQKLEIRVPTKEELGYISNT